MKTKRGACAIIFREINEKREFLLLHRVLNWEGYEFAKGGIELGEEPDEAALREIQEEVGLKDVEVIKRLEKKLHWKTTNCYYDYTAFIVKASCKEEVRLQEQPEEHDSFEWASEKEAFKKLSHRETREMFEAAVKELGKL